MAEALTAKSPPKSSRHWNGRGEPLVQLDRKTMEADLRLGGARPPAGASTVQPRPGAEALYTASVCVSAPEASRPPKAHRRPSGVEAVAERSL